MIRLGLEDVRLNAHVGNKAEAIQQAGKLLG
jgi:mannitol/fructose-specific phosphotransferase system IIA component